MTSSGRVGSAAAQRDRHERSIDGGGERRFLERHRANEVLTLPPFGCLKHPSEIQGFGEVGLRGRAVVEFKVILELGLTAISAPIFHSSGIIAAISVSGPTARLLGTQERQIIAGTVRSAKDISTRLGAIL
jgi:hypothetical protein